MNERVFDVQCLDIVQCFMYVKKILSDCIIDNFLYKN